MNAKTNTQKQREFRERKLSIGLSEVRGIFAKKELHAAVKEKVKLFLAENGGDK
jgi:hypothetical protein